MVDFAESLFANTDKRIPVGDQHFGGLWSEAGRMLEVPGGGEA